jgi:hypothetical protein
VRARNIWNLSEPYPLENARLAHKPACDCRSAYSEDEELEHSGKQRIWLEPVDDPEQYGSDAPDGEYVNVSESVHSDIGLPPDALSKPKYGSLPSAQWSVTGGGPPTS